MTKPLGTGFQTPAFGRRLESWKGHSEGWPFFFGLRPKKKTKLEGHGVHARAALLPHIRQIYVFWCGCAILLVARQARQRARQRHLLKTPVPIMASSVNHRGSGCGSRVFGSAHLTNFKGRKGNSFLRSLYLNKRMSLPSSSSESFHTSVLASSAYAFGDTEAM